jgi:hypothetical protein
MPFRKFFLGRMQPRTMFWNLFPGIDISNISPFWLNFGSLYAFWNLFSLEKYHCTEPYAILEFWHSCAKYAQCPLFIQTKTCKRFYHFMKMTWIVFGMISLYDLTICSWRCSTMGKLCGPSRDHIIPFTQLFLCFWHGLNKVRLLFTDYKISWNILTISSTNK